MVGPMARPGAGPGPGPGPAGRAWASNMKLFCGPGLDIIVAARAGPHNSICGPGLGQVSTTAAGLSRAWASNHICGPGQGLDFRPVQGPSTDIPTFGPLGAPGAHRSTFCWALMQLLHTLKCKLFVI